MAITHGMLDPGNVIVSAPYYIGGKSSLTVPAAGARVATLVNFGRVDLIGGGALIPAPIRVSRAYVFLALVSGNTATTAFEIVKGTATVQDNTNGSERVAVRRKTNGYAAIANTEVSLFMGSGATPTVAGGNFAAVGEAFVYAGAGEAAAFGAGQGLWMPADMVPITLEAGEAAAVLVTLQGVAAVGVLGLCFDFLRQ